MSRQSLNTFTHRSNRFLLIIIILGLSGMFVIGKGIFDNFQNEKQAPEDYLIYLSKNYPEKGQLTFYDPVSGMHTPILEDWTVEDFSISQQNRLAFSSSQEGNLEVYTLDYPFTDNLPVNLTNNPNTEDNLFSWSPDGKYLALMSIQENRKTLAIWDGKTISSIYEHKGKISEVTWSLDNELAFTEFYRFNSFNEEKPSEIFIWGGETTVSISQNPSGEDRFPNWNDEGKLAFLSERNENYDIFVWDGVSKSDGVPDLATFQNIAPDLTFYYSRPIWTNSGTLAFESSAQTPRVQIFEWDGAKATNISQNPDLHNGGQQWRVDGYWAFITYFSPQQLLYVRDEKNQTVLETEGQYVPAWSQNGYLIFCRWDRPNGWELLMWDGAKIIEITQNGIIDAMWRNGENIYCSS